MATQGPILLTMSPEAVPGFDERCWGLEGDGMLGWGVGLRNVGV